MIFKFGRAKKNIIVLIFFAIFTFSGCYFFPEEEALLDAPVIKEEDVIYSTYKAKIKDISSQNIVSGYVYSKSEAECFFTEYTGKIKNVYPKVGDSVEEGDLIAEMNTGTLEYDLEIQKLKVQLARYNYNNSGSEADRLTLNIEENTLNKYKSEYNGAKIFAPISGVVSFVADVDPGVVVDPYTVMAKIADPSEFEVRAALNASSLFKENDSVNVKVGEKTYDGIVREISELNNIYVDFKDEKPTFSELGNFADIILITEYVKDAVVIPKNLVERLDDRVFVKILDENVKKEVDVVTGIENATEIEIKSGLKAGDLVVVR